MKSAWVFQSVKNPDLIGAMPRLDEALAAEGPGSAGDQVSLLLNAAIEDLQILTSLRSTELLPEAAERILNVRYLWLVDTLGKLNAPGSRLSRRKLLAFFLVMAVWEQRFEIRRQILSGVQVSDEFLAELALLIESYKLLITAPADAPLNQKELLERMASSDLAENWPGLIEIAVRFPLCEPDGWFRQAVCFLNLLSPEKLASVLTKSPDWISAAMILRALTLSEVFSIAARARSARAIFVALILVGDGKGQPEDLWQENLKAMLAVLSLSLTSWTRILEAFNRYPVRYPWLQQPLGNALASVSAEALEAYVQAVPMSTSEGCAVQVTRCLSQFRANAGIEARLVLWRCAYEKWDSWEFQHPGNTTLDKPEASIFDYAVLGWLKEGCTDDFVAKGVEAIEQQVDALELEWHESATALNRRLSALLSRYQVFANAQRSPRVGWGAQAIAARPSSLSSDYAMARYGS